MSGDSDSGGAEVSQREAGFREALRRMQQDPAEAARIDALVADAERARAEPTGCPACGSDDYDTEPGADGTPDYENGLKRCQECGEEWA